MVRGCGAGESPYVVASVSPAMQDDHDPAGLTMIVSNPHAPMFVDVCLHGIAGPLEHSRCGQQHLTRVGCVQSGQGMTFPPCVAYARPFAESLDSPASHGTVAPKGAMQHGLLAFTHTTIHIPANSTTATIRVSRTDGKDGPVSVRYYTSDGSAKRGSDYTETAGTLIWADEETGSKAITVQLSGHPQSPQLYGAWSRFLTVTLTHPTGGAVVADPEVAVVRLDADGEFHQDIPKEEKEPAEVEEAVQPSLPWEFAVTEVTGDGRRMRLR